MHHRHAPTLKTRGCEIALFLLLCVNVTQRILASNIYIQKCASCKFLHALRSNPIELTDLLLEGVGETSVVGGLNFEKTRCVLLYRAGCTRQQHPESSRLFGYCYTAVSATRYSSTAAYRTRYTLHATLVRWDSNSNRLFWFRVRTQNQYAISHLNPPHVSVVLRFSGSLQLGSAPQCAVC